MGRLFDGLKWRLTSLRTHLRLGGGVTGWFLLVGRSWDVWARLYPDPRVCGGISAAHDPHRVMIDGNVVGLVFTAIMALVWCTIFAVLLQLVGILL